MKKPAAIVLPRRGPAQRRISKSRCEVASELARLEFEAARLTREIGIGQRRLKLSERALADAEARIGQYAARLLRPRTAL